MNDLTKWTGIKYSSECPNKAKCYRYTAKGSDWQSYFQSAPFEISLQENQSVVSCDFFMEE